MRKYLALAALWAAIPAGAATIGFNVSIDTSAVSGSAGSVFFSFAPGFAPFDPATATISGFTGGTLDPSGPLPAAVIMGTVPPSQFQQNFTYGSLISFQLIFGGPAIVSPNPAAAGGWQFDLFLLDDLDNALLTDNTDTGSVFTAFIEPGTGAVSDQTYPFLGGRSVVNATPISAAVPEPGSGLLLATGAAILATFVRRAQA